MNIFTFLTGLIAYYRWQRKLTRFSQTAQQSYPTTALLSYVNFLGFK